MKAQLPCSIAWCSALKGIANRLGNSALNSGKIVDFVRTLVWEPCLTPNAWMFFTAWQMSNNAVVSVYR